MHELEINVLQGGGRMFTAEGGEDERREALGVEFLLLEAIIFTEEIFLTGFRGAVLKHEYCIFFVFKDTRKICKM